MVRRFFSIASLEGRERKTLVHEKNTEYCLSIIVRGVIIKGFINKLYIH